MNVEGFEPKHWAGSSVAGLFHKNRGSLIYHEDKEIARNNIHLKPEQMELSNLFNIMFWCSAT